MPQSLWLNLNDTKITVKGLLNHQMITYIFSFTTNYLKFYKHRESKDHLDFLNNINIYLHQMKLSVLHKIYIYNCITVIIY